MRAIELLYMLAASFSLAACVPQLKQLFLTKCSDEFSVISWGTWTGAQFMSLIYVTSLGNVLMMLVNVAWVSFYAFMTYLIIRYRRTASADLGESMTEA